MAAPTTTAVQAQETLQAKDTLQALQAAGAPQREPLRFHHASALARRTALQAGPVQALLQARLAALLADLQQRLAAADAQVHSQPPGEHPGLYPALNPALNPASPMPAARPPGPLAALLRSHGIDSSSAAPPALRAVQRHATTWAQLRVDQQLRRSLIRQPDNAGPLNSQRLVVQTLQQLRGLSPAYLQRFMAHAEALLWLHDSSAAGAADAIKRGDSPRPRRQARRDAP